MPGRDSQAGVVEDSWRCSAGRAGRVTGGPRPGRGLCGPRRGEFRAQTRPASLHHVCPLRPGPRLPNCTPPSLTQGYKMDDLLTPYRSS